jgi:hypothetical protein
MKGSCSGIWGSCMRSDDCATQVSVADRMAVQTTFTMRVMIDVPRILVRLVPSQPWVLR